ncbi:hypothetical protein DOK78_002689 [Enterococcus sp. DIV2402]|uniref:EamA domain-containing protein n=1 Tax=Candidatus Enterococcus lowellii TaxID=2230877 RepID=A0ABZ2SR43_9ENTE
MLFEQFHFSASWLVATRLLLAGIILLVIAFVRNKYQVFQPFKDKKDFFDLLAFSILGMFLVQFTYFKTIELSNASFATIVQYTGPFFVVLYESLKAKKMPSFVTLFLMGITLFGVILIASKGEILTVFTSRDSLVWGIGSAIALAFYSIQPRNLLRKYGSFTIVGWGMVLGSVVANCFHPIWQVDGMITRESFVQLLIVVLFGTAIAYLIYLSSLKFISASLASILTAFEPILATVLSVLFFHLTFSWLEIIGFICVLGSILVLQKRV